MLFGLFFGDWTLLVMIPGLIFTIWAQYKVQSSYRKYAAMAAPVGMTGGAVARRILDSNGLHHVPVELVSGHLSDHYDPRHKVLRLSEAVYHGNNVAAVGVAAHEVGHALQDAKAYAPLRLRSVLVPVCNVGSHLAMPLFLVGLIVARLSVLGEFFMLAGIAAFSLSVLFQLVTLPVELNASRRAMRCLSNSRTMSEEQLRGSRHVLSAAAMTYLAALSVGLLSLLRLLLIASSGSRRR